MDLLGLPPPGSIQVGRSPDSAAIRQVCFVAPPAHQHYSTTLYTSYSVMSLHPEAEFLFTSESVNEGHPDKLADQVRPSAYR